MRGTRFILVAAGSLLAVTTAGATIGLPIATRGRWQHEIAVVIPYLIWCCICAAATLLMFLVVRLRRLNDRIEAAARQRTFGARLNDEQRDDEVGRAARLFDEFSAAAGEHVQSLQHANEELTRKIERLVHDARHDPLTGLPNRMVLEEYMERALALGHRDGKPVGLLLIDIDGFTLVNDSLGHAAGDELLSQVARRFVSCTRATDTLTRIGADEFALVLCSLPEAKVACRVAQKLMRAMESPLLIDGRELFVTIAVGIAVHPQDAQDAASLTRAADAALYLAKQAGRNQFRMFAQKMNDAAVERMEMETRLRRAIENEELCVVYQPKIDRNGDLIGLEALARWNNPMLGAVPPLKFIPLAEECGLIASIGAWVLEESCRQVASWLAQGIDAGSVAVNASVRQFSQPGFVDFVERTLKTAGLDPRRLEIEITESLLMSDPEETAAKLQKLRDIGVRVAIDDFGTGYSSLAYLHRLPIDTLKIDQSFVRDMGENAAIIRSIVSLARSLQMKVVAEGVETLDQKELLLRAGCDGMQGYLFARPLPAGDVVAYLAQERRLAQSA
ncbi:MAG: putative bifunctional diguanylate cyclase/phosphodiesterase [Tepidisphaerales bacterium]